ncbi:hypothetical protein PRIC1_006651 [Phytophthora ramorum]|uniref:uncharacterized protein n=1 Tax=Phytophthora ramorum TaxID=164328 RepID=UPI0030B44068|nr:hypothetical protein KRP23_12838 [Phytophthora ramorum]KAH7505871.1 hypothetical protein KRP22_3841 [Phytophthora ramorum]
MQSRRHMSEEPELEPLSGPSTPTRVPANDLVLSDFLAFVDTFPTNSDKLLDEQAEAGAINTAVELVNDDDERSQPLSTGPQSKEQQRRESSRRRERNKYLRKKERIPRLRDEVEQLTEVLADYENGRTRPVGPEVSLRKTNAKEQQLVQVAQQKNELLVENAQLRKQFHRAAAFSSTLQQMLNNEHKLYLANSSYFLVLKPLTTPDCQRELRRSLDVIMPTYGVAKSVNRAREICGWDEKRLTKRADFHNLKSKLLRGKSARFVFNQTWELFLDPIRTEKLFAPVMNVRCRLVQRIDDNNVLFCYDHAASRVLSEKTDIPSVSTMALVTRVSTETGHLIITRGLRRGCVEVQDLLAAAPKLRREIWLETLTWIDFEQRGQDCEVTIGGVTPALRQSSYFWMVECVQLALRWEMAVFGPRFRAT